MSDNSQVSPDKIFEQAKGTFSEMQTADKERLDTKPKGRRSVGRVDTRLVEDSAKRAIQPKGRVQGVRKKVDSGGVEVEVKMHDPVEEPLLEQFADVFQGYLQRQGLEPLDTWTEKRDEEQKAGYTVCEEFSILTDFEGRGKNVIREAFGHDLVEEDEDEADMGADLSEIKKKLGLSEGDSLDSVGMSPKEAAGKLMDKMGPEAEDEINVKANMSDNMFLNQMQDALADLETEPNVEERNVREPYSSYGASTQTNMPAKEARPSEVEDLKKALGLSREESLNQYQGEPVEAVREAVKQYGPDKTKKLLSQSLRVGSNDRFIKGMVEAYNRVLEKMGAAKEKLKMGEYESRRRSGRQLIEKGIPDSYAGVINVVWQTHQGELDFNSQVYRDSKETFKRILNQTFKKHDMSLVELQIEEKEVGDARAKIGFTNIDKGEDENESKQKVKDKLFEAFKDTIKAIQNNADKFPSEGGGFIADFIDKPEPGMLAHGVASAFLPVDAELSTSKSVISNYIKNMSIEWNPGYFGQEDMFREDRTRRRRGRSIRESSMQVKGNEIPYDRRAWDEMNDHVDNALSNNYEKDLKYFARDPEGFLDELSKTWDLSGGDRKKMKNALGYELKMAQEDGDLRVESRRRRGRMLGEDEDLSDVDVEEGKMSEILGVPEDEDIGDAYDGSAEDAVEELVSAVGEDEAASMINYAANISGDGFLGDMQDAISQEDYSESDFLNRADKVLGESHEENTRRQTIKNVGPVQPYVQNLKNSSVLGQKLAGVMDKMVPDEEMEKDLKEDLETMSQQCWNVAQDIKDGGRKMNPEELEEMAKDAVDLCRHATDYFDEHYAEYLNLEKI